MLGIFHVVKLLKDLDANKAVVMNDNKISIELLNNRSDTSDLVPKKTLKRLKKKAKEIKKYLDESFNPTDKISFLYIPREENKIADSLSKKKKVDFNVPALDVSLVKGQKNELEGLYYIKKRAFDCYQSLSPNSFKKCKNQKELNLKIIRMVELGNKSVYNNVTVVHYTDLRLIVINGNTITSIKKTNRYYPIRECTKREWKASYNAEPVQC
jgi:hypothetical protein